jgi:hypothetical protein
LRHLAGFVVLAGLLAIGAVACSTEPESAATPAPTTVVGVPDMVEAPAPIESLDLLIAESFPPQYFMVVTSGLPNSCVKFDGYVIERAGTEIRVIVKNLRPSDEGMVCAQVYGTVETSVPLGSDFESGETYTVEVGDKSHTFVAQ